MRYRTAIVALLLISGCTSQNPDDVRREKALGAFRKWRDAMALVNEEPDPETDEDWVEVLNRHNDQWEEFWNDLNEGVGDAQLASALFEFKRAVIERNNKLLDYYEDAPDDPVDRSLTFLRVAKESNVKSASENVVGVFETLALELGGMSEVTSYFKERRDKAKRRSEEENRNQQEEESPNTNN